MHGPKNSMLAYLECIWYASELFYFILKSMPRTAITVMDSNNGHVAVHGLTLYFAVGRCLNIKQQLCEEG